MARQGSNRRGECWGRSSLGDLARQQGQLEEARTHYYAVMQQLGELSDLQLEQAVTRNLIEVLLELTARLAPGSPA